MVFSNHSVVNFGVVECKKLRCELRKRKMKLKMKLEKFLFGLTIEATCLIMGYAGAISCGILLFLLSIVGLREFLTTEKNEHGIFGRYLLIC